jgi:hypothetical protein
MFPVFTIYYKAVVITTPWQDRLSDSCLSCQHLWVGGRSCPVYKVSSRSARTAKQDSVSNKQSIVLAQTWARTPMEQKTKLGSKAISQQFTNFFVDNK